MVIYKDKVYASYEQVHIYDTQVPLPGLAWTEQHAQQGFARQNSIVNARTLIEFGYALLSINFGSPILSLYERVISTPFTVDSGSITVDGPEEYDVSRSVRVPSGSYTLFVAQRLSLPQSGSTNEEDSKQVIDVFFDHAFWQESHIWKADNLINSIIPLLEDAEIA